MRALLVRPRIIGHFQGVLVSATRDLLTTDRAPVVRQVKKLSFYIFLMFKVFLFFTLINNKHLQYIR